MVEGFIRIYEELGVPSRAAAIARRSAMDSPSSNRTWQIYRDVCQRNPGENCEDEASEGLAKAREHYEIDPPPGEKRPGSMFTRRTRG